MKIEKNYLVYFLMGGLTLILFFYVSSCERPSQRVAEPNNEDSTSVAIKPVVKKAEKASFFVDNSGGMVGYVNRDGSPDGVNNFILAVSDLAQNTSFRRDEVEVNYNLINGPREIVTTELGNSAQDFINCLNPDCFNQGAVSGNDLNAMFQIALDNADLNNLSVFVSDGIYDIQDKTQPITSIISEGFETRNKFIDRLGSQDIQTLLVKLESNFSGAYYYGVTTDGIVINQNRPFYVFILGKSEILNNYFDDQYLENLSGYVNHTRFFLPSDYQVVYEPSTAYRRKGNFRLDRDNSKRITDAERNQAGEFEFSIGVDYSSLPLSDDYLTDKNLYEVNGNFEVIEVENYRPNMVTNITGFEPSHMITLRATGLPQGVIDIKLLNELPAWVAETHTDDDQNIEGDSTTTFGFKYLIQGIVDAYSEVSNQEFLTTKTVTLSRN